MSDLKRKSTLDDRLAEYTDLAMTTGERKESDSEGPDLEFAHMKDMVKRVINAFPPAAPDQDMQRRIRARVMGEFHKNVENNFTPGQWYKNRIFQIGLSLAVIAGLVLVISFLPVTAEGTPGAAGNSPILIPLGIVLIVISVVVFWKLRKKK